MNVPKIDLRKIFNRMATDEMGCQFHFGIEFALLFFALLIFNPYKLYVYREVLEPCIKRLWPAQFLGVQLYIMYSAL